VKRAEGLVGRRRLGYAFGSLSLRTLGWKWLRKPAYRKVIKLPDRLFACVGRLASQRNTLHFLADGGTGQYNERLVEDLRYLRTACNRYVVPAANRLLKGFRFERRLPAI
jgi:hypothetical protein